MAYLLSVGNDLTLAQMEAGEGEPGSDPDQDGSTNADEFTHGTSVSDNSQRMTLGIRPSENGFTLTYPSNAGREHVIETTTDLTDKDSWDDLGDYTIGTGLIISDEVMQSALPTFFRVRSRLP